VRDIYFTAGAASDRYRQAVRDAPPAFDRMPVACLMQRLPAVTKSREQERKQGTS